MYFSKKFRALFSHSSEISAHKNGTLRIFTAVFITMLFMLPVYVSADSIYGDGYSEDSITALYTHITGQYGYFSGSDAVVQELNLHSETNGNGIAATVNTYADVINEHFSQFGLAQTSVYEITAGFEKVSGDDVHIINFENFPTGNHRKTLFSEDADSDVMSRTVSVGNRKAEVVLKFSANKNVTFDELPLCAELNIMKEGDSAQATVYVYSSVKYITVFVPYGTDIVVRVITDAGTVHTDLCDITFAY